MRGVISGGMLVALEQLGMRDCFDFIVGTSAGAICAAFFATERASDGSVVYYTELNDEPFLNRRRLLKLQPAMDLDYLIDEACPTRGLSFVSIAESDVTVYATATPVTPPLDDEAPQQTLFPLTGDPEHVASVLKATASLPVLAGPSRDVAGELYVDGGLLEQVPWRSAVDLGATHILVLPSRPVLVGEDRSPMTFVERITVLRVIRALHGDRIAELAQSLPDRASNESSALRSIAEGTSSALTSGGEQWEGDIEVVELPIDTELPDRMETERPALVDAMIAGAKALIDHFGLEGMTVENRISLNHPDAQVANYRSRALADIVADASRVSLPRR